MRLYVLTSANSFNQQTNTLDYVEDMLTTPNVSRTLAAAMKWALKYLGEVNETVNDDAGPPPALEWDTKVDWIKRPQWEAHNEELQSWFRITEIEL